MQSCLQQLKKSQSEVSEANARAKRSEDNADFPAEGDDEDGDEEEGREKDDDEDIEYDEDIDRVSVRFFPVRQGRHTVNAAMYI